ncbi:hypothetical protein BU24DRAFT_426935 [Aaosphaeria arxii CBS 175.79]|uniref:Cenp-O kinetochore centromere component n=1 Tax=Aaosphaeria arxii CBS 175.79 TaxID=1450172 RepID=A0A6A5XC99_9PLEO|nr:uncharacterized protein BU24DRAFT_426935 [Aaosphaeria arxii CBS 175.79]KAF2010725.1 hypothetical protein BU24DRAFT_426935 [Aaosphaeria arxii CBS 175.79]
MFDQEKKEAYLQNLRDMVAAAEKERDNLAAILLSTPHLSTRLQKGPVANEHLRETAMNLLKRQSKRNVENIYRTCAGVTAYKVRDPDPNAVDNGNILGVRIEVFLEGKFVDKYHVLFNRPNPRHKSMLRVHHHTIPPCIPLQALAAKWMPQSQRDSSSRTGQDLVRFGRKLRKELTLWHIRKAAVDKLRVAAGLPSSTEQTKSSATEQSTYGKVLNAFTSDDETDPEDHDDDDDDVVSNERSRVVNITDIGADLAAQEIFITWSNNQIGAVVLNKDGQVKEGAFRSSDGVRLKEMERKAVGSLEGLLQRLSE